MTKEFFSVRISGFTCFPVSQWYFLQPCGSPSFLLPYRTLFHRAYPNAWIEMVTTMVQIWGTFMKKREETGTRKRLRWSYDTTGVPSRRSSFCTCIFSRPSSLRLSWSWIGPIAPKVYGVENCESVARGCTASIPHPHRFHTSACYWWASLEISTLSTSNVTAVSLFFHTVLPSTV